MLSYEDFKDPDAGKKPTRGGPKVRKAKSDEDLRIHPSWVWKGVRLVEFKTKLYLVKGQAAGRLQGKVQTLDLVAACPGKSKKVFVCPLDLRDETVEAAVTSARKAWHKIVWDGAKRNYRCDPADEDHGEPIWAFASFEELLEAAFCGRVIEKSDDALIDQILGESKPETE